MRVLIGTPLHRDGAYALEKFLANQQQIQQAFPDCDLVFSTDDVSYVGELKDVLHRWGLRGEVITYQVVKPIYAKSRLWDIAGGRESIRRYFLSRPESDGLLFLDADMTYDPQLVSILERELAGYNAVFSGYRFRNNRIGLTGAGCLLLRRQALEKIRFRCYEFQNGQVINEDNMAEMDLFQQGCRIKKGFFLAINHYYSATEARYISPQKVGLYRKAATNSLARFCLIRASVAFHYNIPSGGQRIVWALAGIFDKVRIGSTRRGPFL
jgi:hypothetical protein